MLALVVPDTQLIFPLKTAILQLTAVTLVPVLLGMATRHWATGEWFERFSPFANRSALGALFLTVTVTLAANTGGVSPAFFCRIGGCCQFVRSGNAVGGAFAAKMFRGDKVLVKTMAIEVGGSKMQVLLFLLPWYSCKDQSWH